MAAQNTQKNNDVFQMSAAFGRARARCARTLAKLDACRAAFVAAHGERASTEALAAVVPTLRDRSDALCEMKVTAPAVARSYRLCTDIRGSVLDTPVVDDMTSEAEDAPECAGKAHEVLAAMDELERATDALLSACEALGDEFDDCEGDDTMTKTAATEAPGLRPSGSFSTTGGSFNPTKPHSVARQLVQSLDRLGLPHVSGTISRDDDPGGNLTEQLVRVLGERYELYETDSGTRVRSRRVPIGRYRGGSGELTGRHSVDARAIAFAGDQLLGTLENVASQVRFIERPGIAGSAPRALRAVEGRVDKVRALASSPQGIPAKQAEITAVRLARETFEYLTAIGVEIDIDDAVYETWPEELFDADAVTIPKTPVVREELVSEVVEVGHILWTIRHRLVRASQVRADAEIGFRLEDSLERAMYAARGTLDQFDSVEMADTANLWRSYDIKIEDSCGTSESLGNGLYDALNWLIDVAVPFVEGAREIERMGSVSLDGLAMELTAIADILEACADKQAEYSLEGVAASIAAQTSGLATISRKCADFARRLAS